MAFFFKYPSELYKIPLFSNKPGIQSFNQPFHVKSSGFHEKNIQIVDLQTKSYGEQSVVLHQTTSLL